MPTRAAGVNHAIYLVPFARKHGRLRAADAKPLHATGWIDAKAMTRGARRASGAP
jgi:hypothetical protein